MIRIDLLKPEVVSKKYVDWFLSKEVIRYSDNQYREFTLESQKKYVTSCFNDENIALYGIFDDKKHIGNICLTGLKSFHFNAEVSYFIGDLSYWGRGVASLAVRLIIEHARDRYNLKKLTAGVSSKNIASQKVLINANFLLEGIRKKHLYFNNEWQDQHLYGLLL